MSEMVEITGLWKGKDKNGNTYMTGYMGNAKVLIFANTYKEEDKHPDYKMYIAPKKKESNQDKQERATYRPEDDL
jgi:hypothetical protein